MLLISLKKQVPTRKKFLLKWGNASEQTELEKRKKKQKKESFSRGKIMGKTQTIDTAKRIYFLANFF